MLPFIVSLIVACALRREWMMPTAIGVALFFAAWDWFGAYGQYRAQGLEPSQVEPIAWLNAALSVAEVIAAFLLSWGFRLLTPYQRRRKK